METALMSHIGRKAAIATVTLATVGSTLFGGVALAGGKHNHKDGKDGKKDVEVTQTATGGTARGGDACDFALINLNLALSLGGNGGDQCIAGDASANASNAIGR
jgi:hypothetical protein